MSCADVCLTFDYDAGWNEFYRERTQRARNAYPCGECGQRIDPGATYQYATGKSDGAFWTFRTCARCTEIRTAFHCGSWVFGELWERMAEDLFPVWHRVGAWDCLAKLTTPEAVALCNARFASWLEDADT